MKKLLVLALFSGCLFGGGLGLSWYLKQAEQAAESKDGEETASVTPPVTEATLTRAGVAAQPSSPAVRSKPLSSEEIFRFTETLNKKNKDLDLREAELKESEERLALIQQDLRTQQQLLDGMWAQIQEGLAAANAQADELRAKQEELQAQQELIDNEKKEIENAARTPPEEQIAAAKSFGEVLANMAPESAAKHIRELCARGKMRDVALSLAALPTEQLTAIFTALEEEDLQLGYDIIEEVVRLKAQAARPTDKRKRR